MRGEKKQMETTDILINYIPKSLLIVIAAVFCIGLILKDLKAIPDKYIPLILTGCSVLFCILLNGLNVNSILYGIISAAIAVYTNQLQKQIIKKDSQDNQGK